MKLNDINQKYGSDKGLGHNYLEFYENLFEFKRYDKLNVLEIGVLFGNSLKLWSDYFENSSIYGLDDFSQKNGEEFYNHKTVNVNDIKNSLSSYNRIFLVIENCGNETSINEIFNDKKFDLIIDDANHNIEQQKNNYKLFHKFLKDDGLYICEDVASNDYGIDIINFMRLITPEKRMELINFDVEKRKDDRIILVK